MKQELCLTGPCGGTLLGFLTVIGVATVLSRKGVETDLRWGWEKGQWYGHLRGNLPPDLPELASLVYKGLIPRIEEHPLWLTCLPDAQRRTRTLAFPENQNERDPVCLTGEGPLLATTEAFTPWYQLARRDHWEGILRRTFQRVTVQHIQEALAGPWMFNDPVAGMGLRLSPTENCRYARQWHAPATDPKRQLRGAMIGANRLALESYVWWDTLPNGDGISQMGWRPGHGGARWTWALWREWLPPAAWRTVFSLASLQVTTVTEEHRRDWKAMGLTAVCRVRRMLQEKTLIFLPPEYIYLVTGD